MMSDDELRSELNTLADQVDVTDVTIDQVQARGRRRALYQRGAVVLAAFALVVGGTVAVTSLTGDGAGETDLATEEPGDGDSSGPADAGDQTGDEADGADAASRAAATDDLDATTTTVPQGNVVSDFDTETVTRFEGDGPPEVVAWGDGFLAIGSRWIESDPGDAVLASAFGTSEIAEYFSAAVIEAIESAGDVSFDSADVEAALDAAGVLEEATAVVENNPEVLDWFLAISPGGRSEAFAEFSTDGETWEPVDGFAWPGGGWTPQFVSDGERLVAVVFGNGVGGQAAGSSAAPPPLSVFTTDDLITWVEAPLPLEQPDLPDFASGDFSPGRLTVGDDGWYVTVSFWGWVDLWEALPADVRDELETFGYSWNATPDGIEIQDWSEADAVPVPTTTVVTGDGAVDAAGDDAAFASGPLPSDWSPTVIRVVPWSEMPFSYDEYQAATSGGSETQQAFVGDFDGNVAAATFPGDANDGHEVIATDAGFFMIVTDYGTAEGGFDDGLAEVAEPTLRGFNSADGQQWTEIGLTLPDGAWVDSMARVEGGILVAISGPGAGQRFFVGEPNGTGFVPVDGPDIGNSWVWIPPQASAEGVVAVVDFGQSTTPQFVAWTAAFTHDGYDIELVADEEGTQTITARRDGEVVIERSSGPFDGLPYEWIDDGIQISDPDGETVIEIPLDIVDAEIFAAESEAWNAVWDEDPYVADYRVIATRDGRTWVVEQLPITTADGGWFGTPAINGDTAVVFDDRGNAITVPLP